MNLEDLGRRAVACKHFYWMPGMLLSNGRRVGTWKEGDVCGSSDTSPAYDGAVYPMLDDPATLGCLLHLVREATGQQSSASWYPGGKHDYPHWAWYSDSCYGKLCEGATEAECLVKVLEAAP